MASEVATDAGAPGPASARRGPFPTRYPLSDQVWLAITATGLAGVAPLLFVASTQRAPAASNVWLWAYLLTVIVGLRLAWLISTDARRLFEIIFWLFTYAFMGLAPLVQIRSDTYPGTTPGPDPALNAMAMAIVAVGCLAFGIGVLVAGVGVPRSARRLVTRVSTHRTAILCGFGLLVASYYVVKLGLGTLFSARDVRSDVEAVLWPNFTVASIVRAAATLTLVVGFAALMRLRRERRLVGRLGPSVLPWVVLAVLLLVVNPVSASRYVLGTAVLSVAAALGAIATDRRARVLMISLVLGLIIVFPYADFARTEQAKGPIKIGGPAQALTSADFDAFDQINNTVAYVDTNGYTGGRQIAGALLFWVPRSVWTDKPDNTGQLLGEFREYPSTNLSAPVWTELWIDGGWALLVVGMGALGWVFRRFDERAKAQPRDLRPGVLTGILPFYMIIVLRGSLLQAMAGLAVVIAAGLFATRRVVVGPDQP